MMLSPFIANFADFAVHITIHRLQFSLGIAYGLERLSQVRVTQDKSTSLSMPHATLG